jgi:hypothetical protein
MYRILSKGIISRNWKMSTEQNVNSLAANKTVSCSLEVTRIVKNFPFNILFFSCYKIYSSDRKGIRFPVLLQRVWYVTLEILTVQQKPHSIHWTAHTLPGSSVSIVSWLWTGRLGDWSSIHGRGKGFFLLCPDRLWGPPSLLYNGYRGGPFSGAKRSRGVTLTIHSYLVPRSRMGRSYTSSPPKHHHGV